MINNPVAFSIDYLADASKDIPNMVVQLSFLVMSGIIGMPEGQVSGMVKQL